MSSLNLKPVDPSWEECLQRGLSKMSSNYLNSLSCSDQWLPGPDKIFNTFAIPLHKVNYVLFGESPYPRRESANGYAFWDANVKDIWSPTGLSKQANRATSLRNLLKMLLIAEGRLDETTVTQEDIAKLDKKDFVQTNDQLFTNFLEKGFLLLNASLVLQDSAKQKDAKAWYPFMQELLICLLEKRPQAKFILFGSIASKIEDLITTPHFEKLSAEHPYNHSFITNPDVLAFFKPLHLLRKSKS